MNIGGILKDVMVVSDDSSDDSHLRSNVAEGSYHDSQQWHDENAHLIYTG